MRASRTPFRAGARARSRRGRLAGAPEPRVMPGAPRPRIRKKSNLVVAGTKNARGDHRPDPSRGVLPVAPRDRCDAPIHSHRQSLTRLASPPQRSPVMRRERGLAAGSASASRRSKSRVMRVWVAVVDRSCPTGVPRRPSSSREGEETVRPGPEPKVLVVAATPASRRRLNSENGIETGPPWLGEDAQRATRIGRPWQRRPSTARFAAAARLRAMVGRTSTVRARESSTSPRRSGPGVWTKRGTLAMSGSSRRRRLADSGPHGSSRRGRR